uniref:Uncharacterized protein n=1 Tax=Romanomermis culicivorax TaxID=13658 RepID=A0A915L122_ROMCU
MRFTSPLSHISSDKTSKFVRQQSLSTRKQTNKLKFQSHCSPSTIKSRIILFLSIILRLTSSTETAFEKVGLLDGVGTQRVCSGGTTFLAVNRVVFVTYAAASFDKKHYQKND